MSTRRTAHPLLFTALLVLAAVAAVVVGQAGLLRPAAAADAAATGWLTDSGAQPDAMGGNAGAGQDAAAGEGDMDAMMEAWIASMTPGEAHRVMDRLAGTWNTRTRMWWGGEGNGDPMESEGTSVVEWILDGRFLEERNQGTLMGQPITGRGIYGFDNNKKKYTAMWIDTMTTSMLISEGTLSRDGDIITYFGSMDEPMTGEHDKTVMYVSRFIDDNKRVFEIHDMSIVPGNTKVLEVIYTRANDTPQGARTRPAPAGR